MASAGKKKTTMAKLSRESRLRERRLEKEARKRARKDAAARGQIEAEAPPEDHVVVGPAVGPAGDDAASQDAGAGLPSRERAASSQMQG
jgi:hypothetical protein